MQKIVNGIDYNEYNPLTDPGLVKHYSDRSVNLKKYNKKWLQKHYKLEVNLDIPLICMTSRITEQKGFRAFSLHMDACLWNEGGTILRDHPP